MLFSPISTVRNFRKNKTRYPFTILLLLSIGFASGQELEPRLLTNVPVKTNFLVAYYGYSQGNILLDPSINIADLNSKISSYIVGYARSFSFFGMSAKFDAIVPLADGFWDGKLDGEYRTREVSGFGDPRMRLSVNFLGAPAIKMTDFVSYRPKNVLGASVQVFLPIGQYDPNKLINLGGNRFVIKPQLGFSTRKGSWIFESYASLWLFTQNNNFLDGNIAEQKPLFTFKQHLIKTFKNRMWMSLDAGYAIGGASVINGNLSNSRISSMRFGAMFVYPFAKQHSLKLSLNTAIRLEKGPDYDNIGLAYQFMWGKQFM